MISVTEALNLVTAESRDFGIEDVALLQSVGRVLAVDALADRDYPPFDRVTMDGIAIASSSFIKSGQSFAIEAVQAAGMPQLALQNNAQCIEVMTGAMLPKGADAVIPYELCCIANGVATPEVDEIIPFQNVHIAATDSTQGDVIVNRDTTITAAIIGLLASAGYENVSVYGLPKTAVCSTGDELVEIADQPLPHQIRRSNSYMLSAALNAQGIAATRYHLPDEPVQMTEQLNTITNYYDVVLLSGAVSKGKFDHLPNVLNKLGFQTIFHGIAQRPGKPFLFGKTPGGALIFAFPGNPASTYVCFHIYFGAWLNKCINKQFKTASAFLNKPYQFKPALTLHLQAELSVTDGRLVATPVNASTSGDLVSLSKTEALLSLPADRVDFGTDEAFPVTLTHQ